MDSDDDDDVSEIRSPTKRHHKRKLESPTEDEVEEDFESDQEDGDEDESEEDSESDQYSDSEIDDEEGDDRDDEEGDEEGDSTYEDDETEDSLADNLIDLEDDNEEDVLMTAAEEVENTSSSQIDDCCTICLAEFEDQTIGNPNSCRHIFCLPCIQEWAKNTNSCPVDRKKFNKIVVKTSKDGQVTEELYVEDKELGDQFEEDVEPTYCEVCHSCEREDRLLLCDGCDHGYHLECLDPPLEHVPIDEWYCPECPNRDEEPGPSHDQTCSSTRTRSARGRGRGTGRGARSVATMRASRQEGAIRDVIASILGYRPGRGAATRRGRGRSRGASRGRSGSRTKARGGKKGRSKKRRTRKRRSTSSRSKTTKTGDGTTKRKKRRTTKKKGGKVKSNKAASKGAAATSGNTTSRGKTTGRSSSTISVAPSFSLFGNPFDLDEFHGDPDEEFEAKQPERTENAASRRQQNSGDVLGNILTELDAFDSGNAEIQRDGTVILKDDGKKTHKRRRVVINSDESNSDDGSEESHVKPIEDDDTRSHTEYNRVRPTGSLSTRSFLNGNRGGGFKRPARGSGAAENHSNRTRSVDVKAWRNLAQNDLKYPKKSPMESSGLSTFRIPKVKRDTESGTPSITNTSNTGHNVKLDVKTETPCQSKVATSPTADFSRTGSSLVATSRIINQGVLQRSVLTDNVFKRKEAGNIVQSSRTEDSLHLSRERQSKVDSCNTPGKIDSSSARAYSGCKDTNLSSSSVHTRVGNITDDHDSSMRNEGSFKTTASTSSITAFNSSRIYNKNERGSNKEALHSAVCMTSSNTVVRNTTAYDSSKPVKIHVNTTVNRDFTQATAQASLGNVLDLIDMPNNFSITRATGKQHTMTNNATSREAVNNTTDAVHTKVHTHNASNRTITSNNDGRQMNTAVPTNSHEALFANTTPGLSTKTALTADSVKYKNSVTVASQEKSSFPVNAGAAIKSQSEASHSYVSRSFSSLDSTGWNSGHNPKDPDHYRPSIPSDAGGIGFKRGKRVRQSSMQKEPVETHAQENTKKGQHFIENYELQGRVVAETKPESHVISQRLAGPSPVQTMSPIQPTLPNHQQPKSSDGMQDGSNQRQITKNLAIIKMLQNQSEQMKAQLSDLHSQVTGPFDNTNVVTGSTVTKENIVTVAHTTSNYTDMNKLSCGVVTHNGLLFGDGQAIHHQNNLHMRTEVAHSDSNSAGLLSANDTRINNTPTSDPRTVNETSDRDKQRKEGIKRLQRLNHILDEVKLALKPFYNIGEINKEEYKLILRKGVDKINDSGRSIERHRVQSLIRKYVERYQEARRNGTKVSRI